MKEIIVRRELSIEETVLRVRMRNQEVTLTLSGRERLSWCSRTREDQAPRAPTGVRLVFVKDSYMN